MAEMRFDPIKRKWTVIAQERGGRRDGFIVKGGEGAQHGSACPFCNMDDGKALPPIFKINSKADQSKAALVVTPNKYPVMRVEGELKHFGDGVHESISGIGAHEIVIDSPRHGLKLCEYTEEELFNLFFAFKVRVADLIKDVRFRYFAAFKNIGFEAGELINHPHAQIMAAPAVPSHIENMIMHADTYYKEKERCIFCDIIADERKNKSRVVLENYEYVALCPYASEYPFEVAIYPKKHEPFYSNSNENSIMQLADIVREIFSRMSVLLDCPAVNIALRLTPPKSGRPDLKGYLEHIEHSYHWHLELRPVITLRSGSEWGSGLTVNPLKPEEAAAYLREVASL